MGYVGYSVQMIELSSNDYWGVAFLFFCVGIYFTMHFMLEMPNEKDKDDEL